MAKAKKSDKELMDDFVKTLEDKYNAYFVPEVHRTGIISLDLVLNGGLETGSLIELSGESQSGKSTLVLNLVKNMADKGFKTLYIDAEGSVKEDMIRGIGLGPYLATSKKRDNLFTVVRSSGYTAVENLIDSALETKAYKIFVIDSLSALSNDEYIDIESDRNATETRIGMDAQLTSRFLKKLNALKTDYKCVFIIINQTRVDLSNSFKPTYSSTGGQAVKFYPDIRLFMRVKDKLKEKKELIIGEQEIPIGANCLIEARKSRLGAGNIPYPIQVRYGKGINNLATYQYILPQIYNDKGQPILDKTSSVTYVLHLPSGDDKTSGGIDTVPKLIADHYDEVCLIVDNYLTEYFEKIKEDAISSSGEFVETSEVSTVSLDDALDFEM